MNLAVACDENFAEQAGSLIGSLAVSQDPGRVQILLMHPGLSQDVLQWLVLQGRDCVEVNPYTITDELPELKMPAYLSTASAFRLIFPLVAPKDWEHAIYLDADIIVRGSLQPLWDLRGETALVAMVRDAGVPTFGSTNGPPWRSLGVDPTEAYFNAGVVLFNLREWRSRNSSRQALELLKAHSLPYGDQCALNAVAKSSVLELDPVWNAMANVYRDDNAVAASLGVPELARIRSESIVVHFNTDRLGRPWNADCQHPLKSLWVDQRSDLIGEPLRHRDATGSRSVRTAALLAIVRTLRRAAKRVTERLKSAERSLQHRDAGSIT